MVFGRRACLPFSPRLCFCILILVVLLLLLFPPSASHGTSWSTGENSDATPYSSETLEGNRRNTEMAGDVAAGGHTSALTDVEGSARQVPTGPDPLHHRRKPVSP